MVQAVVTVRLVVVQAVFLVLHTIQHLIPASNVAQTALLAVDQTFSSAIPVFVAHSSLLTQLASNVIQVALLVMQLPLVAPPVAQLMYSLMELATTLVLKIALLVQT